MPCRISRDSVLPKPAAELEVPDRLGDPVPLLPAGDLDAGQRLGLFHRGRLGEVHDVDRGLVGLAAAR